MSSNTADFALFDAAGDFTTSEVVEYRRVIFPLLLGDSMHVPFFSVEGVPGWMTARGYALYQELNLAEHFDPLRGYRYAFLHAYREQVIGKAYVNHPFFQVDRADDWVAPALFNTWMRLMRELEEERGCKINRFDVAASPSRSRTISAHPNSCPSYSPGSGFSSRATSPSAIIAFDLDIPSMIQPLHVESPPAPPETTAIPQETVTLMLYFPARRRSKGKGKPVEEDLKSLVNSTSTAIPVTTAPQTWTVSRDKAAYKLDVRANTDVLKNKKGNKIRIIDAYIKAEDQDAWDGSTGHTAPKGDIWVYPGNMYERGVRSAATIQGYMCL
ncbi:hypothetical protein B0H14DRAFT_2578135 [Mycena olivaceomarginata]|nr:hypothetical protein B0H14DRAFT_2578135 [Mycena olivaceomarginata]